MHSTTMTLVVETDSAPPRLTSLYAAIRLARMIQHVRQRLKERVLSRTKRNALSQCEAVEGRCAKDERRQIVHRFGLTQKLIQSQCPPKRPLAEDTMDFPRLLKDLDDHVSSTTKSLSTVAGDDRLFLQQQQASNASFADIRTASHVLDVSTLLIGRVQFALRTRSWESQGYKASARAECEKFLANLEHLLLCYQQAALEALVTSSLNKLQADFSYWDKYLEQQKKIYSRISSEWASGRPPLNSTMPWNIKPSLVVLWGVCWMFYNNTGVYTGEEHVRQARDAGGQGDMGRSMTTQPPPQQHTPQQAQQTLPRGQRHQAQQGTGGPGWFGGVQNYGYTAQQSPRIDSDDVNPGLGLNFHHVTGGGAPNLTGFNATSVNPSFDTSLAYSPQAPQHQVFGRRRAPSASGPFASASSQAPHASPSFNHTPGRPRNASGANITPSSSSESSFPSTSPDWGGPRRSTISGLTNHQQQSWQPGLEQATAINAPVTTFPHYPTSTSQLFDSLVSTTATAATNISTFDNRDFSNVPQQPDYTGSDQFYPNMSVGVQSQSQATDNYPSPHSEASARENMNAPINQMSPSMEYGSRRNRDAGTHANKEPPYDSQGQIYCDHEECAAKPPTFSRKCEWTKHMDKHWRPYVCKQPGCEKIRGFTYSGGLLRHEREVHKKYGGPKVPRFCPHKDCKRSAGQGFSRKENLTEHLRRVHRGKGIEEVQKEKPARRGGPLKEDLAEHDDAADEEQVHHQHDEVMAQAPTQHQPITTQQQQQHYQTQLLPSPDGLRKRKRAPEDEEGRSSTELVASLQAENARLREVIEGMQQRLNQYDAMFPSRRT